jgi:selenocysteine-specific elongation factor
MRVIATAGHVDHGKSSLVLALTGTDPDRFPEEKERGLTIDLGFAFTHLPSGTLIGFVDVPGHVKFVKNMLAGVGAIEVALLVIAANEGWKPQTEEHVRILELLGVQHGVIAVTKATTVDDDTVELVRLELDERLAGSAFERWPVVVTDSVAGIGVDALRAALDNVLATAPSPYDAERPRLWVDRVFAARGAGTVVTGTLTGGSFAIDDDVLIEPGAKPARVRGIQSHHERLPRVEPGSRVALNLAGIDHQDVTRGDAVVRNGQWLPVDVVDAELRVLGADTMHGPRRRAFDVHVGSGQRRATMRVLDESGRYGRLRFDAALPLVPGDRVVLRSSARQATVGGAEVLDITPAPRVAGALARLALPLGQRLLAARPWLLVDELTRLGGCSPRAAQQLAVDLVAGGAARPAGKWFVAAGELDRVVRGSVSAVEQFHDAEPTAAGLDLASLARSLGVDRPRLRAALDAAGAEAGIVIERDVVRRAGHRSGAEQSEGRRLLDALEAEPFAPPAPTDIGAEPATIRALVRDGSAVELDGVLFATSAVDDARRRVAAAVRERGELTVAEIRDLLGSTRKYVLPLVNRFDAEGVTRRRGDARVLGPAAARFGQLPPESVG